MPKTSAFCFSCLLSREEKKIRHFADEDKKAAYMRLAMKEIAAAPKDSCTPYYSGILRRLFLSYWGEGQDYETEKRQYNALMLQKEAALWDTIRKADDPLSLAIRLARAGNYIDFGALFDVQESMLDVLLQTAMNEQLPQEEYDRFRTDCQKGGKMLYLTDNCGEIVLDKLLIRLLKETYPQLAITVMVRGKNTLNDATPADAEAVGITDLVPVIDNGTDFAGTILETLPASSLQTFEQADVVLSKGQANFESLYGCGKNIYYLLLCKCEWFVMQFGMKQFSGVFANENRLSVRRGTAL